MRTGSPNFNTEELSEKTWPDFVKLFGKPAEWGVCHCMYYQRARPLPKKGAGGVDQRTENR